MSGFLGKQTLPCHGAFFAYDPRGKEGAGFTSPWRNSKTSLLNDRSTMSHLSGMEGNHLIYRHDSNSSEETQSSATRHTPVKQGFMRYKKSPEISSPTAAASLPIRKQKTGGETSSSPSENSVYLAIPRPVYGHNPCCNELGCMLGQRYSVEHSSPRIPNTVYERDWMQTDAHYAEKPSVERKGQDTVLQQRVLQFEHSTDTLNSYSPVRGRTLPAVIEPHYSSYPCTPTRPLFGSLSEHSQPLQTSPRGYPSLYPSHPTYEHMTSEVYQELEWTRKRQKLETEIIREGNKNDSPPMPVIDNVFSLAPYQGYLQGGISGAGASGKTCQSSEQHEVKSKPDKEKKQDQAKQEPVVCLVFKETHTNTPKEKSAAEAVEPKNVKVEKLDKSDISSSTDDSISPNNSSKMEVKKEPTETVTQTQHNTNRSSPFPPKPTTPLPGSKLNFKNIPPQCLKLSTYKIIIPNGKNYFPVPPPQTPTAQPAAEFIPNQDLQMPARKHFFELHQSFCKLVSKSVSTSSEQDLKKWLSQLKLTESLSHATKVQKERCPFPHVMRTGAVFLPMLVVKELLFPMVHGITNHKKLHDYTVGG
uniref:Uncharacterized protein n=1 Tax=Oreochromis niloticus TaxID=8128 RepID=A0A669CIR6_ORENI